MSKRKAQKIKHEKKEQKVFKVSLPCPKDKCEGYIHTTGKTGQKETGGNIGFQHLCLECGQPYILEQTYPAIIYENLDGSRDLGEEQLQKRLKIQMAEKLKEISKEKSGLILPGK